MWRRFGCTGRFGWHEARHVPRPVPPRAPPAAAEARAATGPRRWHARCDRTAESRQGGPTMKRVLAFHHLALLVAALAGCGGDAPTGFVQQATAVHNDFCPSGTCVIEHPVIINVYWETSFAAWDDDIA